MSSGERMKAIYTAIFSLFIVSIFASGALAASDDFSQCANKDPTPSSCNWIGSILQPTNSNYTEGMSVPQREIITDIAATPGNVHTFTFDVAWTKSGIHAYDFLTAWNQGNDPTIAQLNPCDDLDPTLTSICLALHNSSNFTTASFPDDPYISSDGATQPKINAYEVQYGDRTITMYANAPVTNLTITLVHDEGNLNDTGDSFVTYNISWVSTATVVIFEFAGHLAVSGNSSIGWGPGQGAGSISGGPYHFKIGQLDGGNLGADDNQVQAGAILPAPLGNLTVIKHVINNNGGSAVASNFTMFVTTPFQNFTFAGSESGTTVQFLAGNYTVTESSLAGYNGTLSANCTGTINGNQSKTCVITNDDAGASITVVKQIINDNGGTLDITGVTLMVDGNVTANNTPVSVAAGAHVVSETPIPGYTTTIGGDCAANGSVSVTLSDSKVCTITNDDVASTITVVKQIVNDNGGNATMDDFILFVNATPVLNGSANVFAPGAYTVNELGSAGYNATFSGDCNRDGTLTLGLGENKTCTITNDDVPATLIVRKFVINDNGGTLNPSDFNMSVTATNPSAASFPGDSNGTTVTIDAGAYNVGEVAVLGYGLTTSNSCAGTAKVGDVIECNMTNDDVQAMLTVVKIVVNDNGGTAVVADFNLTVNGTPVQSGNDTPFNAGTYVVAESGPSGYAGTFGGDCDENGTVTLTTVDSKTCTITNDDVPASITVIKQVINDNGGTLTAGDFSLFVDNTSVTSNVSAAVSAGAHIVSEVAIPGYVGNISGDCDANGNVVLAPGDAKVCIITNDDQQATLTVTKIVLNTNGSTANVSDFTLYVNSTAVTSGVPSNFDAGVYFVSETGPSGYNASFGGDCDINGSVTLLPGDSKACTITNDDAESFIIVEKIVINDNGGTRNATEFDITLDGFTVDLNVSVPVNSGGHFIAEGFDPAYTRSFGGDCDENGTLSIAAGETKKCVIVNNDRPATLTVIKNVTNDNGGALNASDFTLYVNGSVVTNGVPVELSAGVYVVSEDTVAGYGGTFSGDCDLTGIVTLQIGDNKTCYITNDDLPASITVVKIVVNDDGGTLNATDFTLYLGNTTVTSGVPNVVNAGEYLISELGASGYVASFSGDCNENGSIAVTPGQNKTCTITNDDANATLVVTKRVVNDNGGTLEVANFTLYVDGVPVTSGEPIALGAGVHNVSELAVLGYNGTFSGDCDENGTVTLAVGDQKGCVIINDDQQATLTVIKNVTNDNGGTLQASNFTLYVDNATVASGVPTLLDAGAHVVSEDAVAGYAGSISGDCDPSGAVTLAPGESKVCYITNDDTTATLTVLKVVQNNNGGILSVSDFPLFIDGSPTTSGTPVPVSAGLHFVSEINASGYTGAITGDCEPNGTVILAPGDNKVCVIVNDDQPSSITVIKNVINDNGATLTVSDFALYVDATLVESNVSAPFPPGTYVVSENESSAYQSSFSGDCDANGTLTLGLGEHKTCTITNNDIAQLTCQQALDLGLLKGVIVGGNATITNNASQSFIVSLASYKMYAPTIFDQTLFDTETIAIGANSTVNIGVDLPACGYQIDLVCGEPVVPPFFDEEDVLDFDFGNQQNYCSAQGNGSVDLSIAPWFPQNKSYVFVCDVSGFTPTSYNWYFGDGQYQFNSPNQDVWHTYAANGTYNVSCTATNGTVTDSDTLQITVGTTVVPPVNQSNGTNVTPPVNQTNGTNVTPNVSACYNSVYDIPASCTGGTITVDEKNGCRTIICASGGASMQVLACNKPGDFGPTGFEMYKQSQTGSGLKICLGSACIEQNGFAKASFPICTGNVTVPPQNTTNSTGGNASVLIAPWFPQANNFVFICSNSVNATTFDWIFGDGQKQLNSLNGNVWHTYASPGTYTVSCTAYGSSTAKANLTVTV
jgi:hypothetical protein